MTLQYSDIADLVSAGKTPTEIASLLAVRTVKPLLIADLENYVFQNGIARRNGITGAWQGPLIDAMTNPQFPSQLRAGIEELMSFINNRTSVSINTTKEPRASQNAGLLPGLLQTGILTESQVGEILALAGGYRFPGITAEDVQAVIDAEPLRIIRNATRDWWVAKQAVVEDGLHRGTITTVADVVAAIGGE